MIDEPVVDEEALRAAQRLVRLTALRGSPVDGDRCATCRYYLEPDAPFAFCWHDKLKILVGADWWCQHWEMP